MSDLISRQSILDRTVKKNSVWNAITDSEGNNLEDIINSIPPTKNNDEWIPVSERLPEEDIVVLIWCPERRNIYCACLEENQWWILGAYKVPFDVTAWMPLPEPYKKGT